MREIKFRAWSRGVKADSVSSRRQFGEWVFPPQMLYDEKPGDCLVWKSQGQDIEVMQYTGLKDKNGKEIYESDILVEGLSSDEKYAHEVVWSQDDCAWMFKYDGDLFTTSEINFEQCEIIGNIYENPELVKEEQA